MPLTFYRVVSGGRDLGFDSELLQFKDGRALGSPLAVTRYAEEAIDAGEPDRALGARFPAAAPSIFPGRDGRPQLDILETLVPTVPGAPKLIAYQRLDLSGWLRQ